MLKEGCLGQLRTIRTKVVVSRTADVVVELVYCASTPLSKPHTLVDRYILLW
jgi:hypothetical protein